MIAPQGQLPAEYVGERVRARAIACLGGPAHAREAVSGSAALVLGSADPDLRVQLGQTLRALVLELGQGFHYIGCVSFLWALLFCGRRLAARPEFWLLPVYFAFHTAALIHLGMRASYVSDRHVMPLVKSDVPTRFHKRRSSM